jgi:transcriptional regulator with XRE-family HTH domain
MSSHSWVRLGAALAAARDAAGLKQEDVSQKLGVSRATVQNIEYGKGAKRITPGMRAYARLVGWTDDSIETVLADGEPTTADVREDGAKSPAGPREVPTGDLPLRIVQELAEGDGPLLDATTITLSTPGSRARMTVVVRGEPDASPEEIRDALLAWRRAERRLQHLDDDEPDSAPPAGLQ